MPNIISWRVGLRWLNRVVTQTQGGSEIDRAEILLEARRFGLQRDQDSRSGTNIAVRRCHAKSGGLGPHRYMRRRKCGLGAVSSDGCRGRRVPSGAAGGPTDLRYQSGLVACESILTASLCHVYA